MSAWLVFTFFVCVFLFLRWKLRQGIVPWGDQRRALVRKTPYPWAASIEGLTETRNFFINSRGRAIYFYTLVKKDVVPKTVVYMFHGYAGHSDREFKDMAVRIARQGHYVYAMDHEGHGRSDGLHVYIEDFNNLILDANQFIVQTEASYESTKEQKKRTKFIVGLSMGGGIALELAEKYPGLIDGLILLAPMCIISKDVQPPAAAVKFLTMLLKFFPAAPITPVPSLAEKAFTDKEMYRRSLQDSISYTAKMRLSTAMQLNLAVGKIQSNIPNITTPFIVCHGDKDEITKLEGSQFLYDNAGSKDKTLKIYPGMCHVLMLGESKEKGDLVYAEIFDWIDKRS